MRLNKKKPRVGGPGPQIKVKCKGGPYHGKELLLHDSQSTAYFSVNGFTGRYNREYNHFLLEWENLTHDHASS